MFDYSSGEPPSNVLTVLRAVTVCLKSLYFTRTQVDGYVVH